MTGPEPAAKIGPCPSFAKPTHPEVDFRGLTPNRSWAAEDAETVIDAVLQQWFEGSDEIEEIEHLETDAFADRERVGYRFRVRNPEGVFEVEQQVCIGERDGRIGWIRSVCSGFRPVDTAVSGVPVGRPSGTGKALKDALRANRPDGAWADELRGFARARIPVKPWPDSWGNKMEPRSRHATLATFDSLLERDRSAAVGSEEQVLLPSRREGAGLTGLVVVVESAFGGAPGETQGEGSDDLLGPDAAGQGGPFPESPSGVNRERPAGGSGVLLEASAVLAPPPVVLALAVECRDDMRLDQFVVLEAEGDPDPTSTAGVEG